MTYGAPPRPPEPDHHACLSGSLWCSGVMPCLECFYALRDVTMPSVVVEAGLNGAATLMLFDLVNALRQRGIDPAQHLGVVIDPAKLDPNTQIRTALAAFEQAVFGRLQERLANDPDLRRRLRTTRVGPPPPQPGYHPFDTAAHSGGGFAPDPPSPFGPDGAQSFPYGPSPYPDHADPYTAAGEPPMPASPYPPYDPRVQSPAGYEPSAPPTDAASSATVMGQDPFDGLGFMRPGGAGAGPQKSVALGSIFTAAGIPNGPRPAPPVPNVPATPPVAAVPIERLEPRVTKPLEVEEIVRAASPLDDGSDHDRIKNGAG